MKMTAQEYARRVQKAGPHSPLLADWLWAFCVGGGICLLGEGLRQLFLRQGADAEAAGCKLYLGSGYRSVERQTALFKRKTNSFMAEGFSREEAEKQAAMWVARPGTSEHNTGLAADIVSADWYSKHSDLTADFEDTPEFEWLYAHCADYGFILRYPRGKENVTGVTYEPWHYRYVGKDAAKAIMQAGGTLEEYTGAHTA